MYGKAPDCRAGAVSIAIKYKNPPPKGRRKQPPGKTHSAVPRKTNSPKSSWRLYPSAGRIGPNKTARNPNKQL